MPVGTHKSERYNPPGWPVARAFALALLFVLAGVPAAKAQEPPQAPAEENPKTPPMAPDASRVSSDSSDDPEAMFPHFENTRYWLSGQANFIYQTNPPFYAAYSGKNSMDPNYDKATSRVMTLYTGIRLNNSFELLADVEMAAGAGLSNAVGLAGITNLDVVRIPGEGSPLSTAPYLARGMIHKVFSFSKDSVTNERSPFSLFDELPSRRLEVRFGKFSLADFFDQNSVASDTHFQFTNWTIDQTGAWDYAADTRGYTVGLITDYEDGDWGFRFAEALMPKVANGIDLVWKPWEAHSENFQYELRRGFLPKKPGAVRVLAYTNYANMGIYSEAIAQFEEGLVPRPEITNHPWHITRKYGFAANFEQQIFPNISIFSRFGWNNDKTESFAFTEVGQTFAGGMGVHGVLWHRRQDRAGVALVSNAISKDHQTYLADGGYGFLLGDGKLRYGREDIVETYYTLHVWRGLYVGPGLQHIVNPGYNRDRGPVLVPGFRAHLEF